jgi:hypothetical protein
VIHGGGSLPATVGASVLAGKAGTIRWTATSDVAGVNVTPPSGTLDLTHADTATLPVTIAVAQNTPSGYHPVTVDFRTADGKALPGSAVVVTVPAADGAATACDTLGATDTECGLRLRDNGDGHTATVTIDYYDHGTGSWSLQYDSTSGAYKQSPSVAKTGTDTWKTATFTVDDAAFGNRENAGTDFRLANNGDTGTIARVHVTVTGDKVLALHLCPDDN